MRTVWHSVLLTCLLVGSADAANRIQITALLDTATQDISGWVTVTWPSIEEPLEDVRFRLYANMRTNEGGAGGGEDSAYTTVDSISANGADLIARCKLDGTDFYASLDRKYMPGESLTVRVHFKTHVTTASVGPDRLFCSANSYLLDGWFPMPAPRRDGDWVRIQYSRLVELVADFFDFEVQFSAPASFKVAGPGLVSTDSSNGLVTHSYSLPTAHDFALYLSPDLKTKQYTYGSVSIAVHTPESIDYTADEIAEVCGHTLECMGQLVAPYPFPDLHVVVCKLGFLGGIELPRMIICSEPTSGRVLGTRDIVTIHEVVHQWFYGIIHSNQASSPWLDEAVTDYFTERVSRSLYGESSFMNRWGWRLDYASLQRLQGLQAFDRMPITLPAEQYFSMPEYSATVYNKGAVILRTIFAQMQPGDEYLFWRRYFDRYRFKRPSETDFINLISEYPPFVGNAVVADLLHTTMSIDYVVEEIANEPLSEVAPGADSSGNDIESKSSVRATVLYAMYNPIALPVTLRLTFADGTTRDTLISPREGQAKIAFTGVQPLISAALDPDHRFGLDKNLLNNSLTLTGNGSSLRLFSGITLLVESLFSYMWGI